MFFRNNEYEKESRAILHHGRKCNVKKNAALYLLCHSIYKLKKMLFFAEKRAFKRTQYFKRLSCHFVVKWFVICHCQFLIYISERLNFSLSYYLTSRYDFIFEACGVFAVQTCQTNLCDLLPFVRPY